MRSPRGYLIIDVRWAIVVDSRYDLAAAETRAAELAARYPCGLVVRPSA